MFCERVMLRTQLFGEKICHIKIVVKQLDDHFKHGMSLMKIYSNWFVVGKLFFLRNIIFMIT